MVLDIYILQRRNTYLGSQAVIRKNGANHHQPRRRQNGLKPWYFWLHIASYHSYYQAYDILYMRKPFTSMYEIILHHHLGYSLVPLHFNDEKDELIIGCKTCHHHGNGALHPSLKQLYPYHRTNSLYGPLWWMGNVYYAQKGLSCSVISSDWCMSSESTHMDAR